MSDDRVTIANKLAKELRARPGNEGVDSAWYCIAVHIIKIPTNRIRLLLSRQAILGWVFARSTKSQSRAVQLRKLEPFFGECENHSSRLVPSSAYPACSIASIRWLKSLRGRARNTLIDNIHERTSRILGILSREG